MDCEAAVGDDPVGVARSRTGTADVVAVAGYETSRPVTGRTEIAVDPANPAIGAGRGRDAAPVGGRQRRNSDNQDACDRNSDRSGVDSAVADLPEHVRPPSACPPTRP